MFSNSGIGAFRSRQVYETDFPNEESTPPHSFLGFKPYSIKRLIERRNGLLKGVPPQNLVTIEDRASFISSYSNTFGGPVSNNEGEMEFIDRALIRRGYEYYHSEVAHEQYVSSVAPNLRDIETFANIPGLARGRIYRSGFLLSNDPEKLLHVLKNILQIKSILDLRGFVPLKSGSGDPAESITRDAIFSRYRPFVFDPFLRQWLYLGQDYGLLGLKKVREQADKSLSFMPRAAQELEVFCSNCSIFCFNLGFPNPGISDEFQRIMQPIRNVLHGVVDTDIIANTKKLVGSWDATAPEHYIIRLLISGANDEAILTDYCASEAGLSSFNEQIERQLKLEGESRYLGQCHPRFSETSQFDLKRRFIHPNQSAYKTSPSLPFWTENPSILIPSKPLPSTTPTENFRCNASMLRVLRVVTLLRLRDAFDIETEDPRHGGWIKARNKLRLLCRKRHRLQQLSSLTTQTEVNPPIDDSHVISPTSFNEQIRPQTIQNKNQELIRKKIFKLTNGLKEILVARKIILEKLTDAIKPLTRSDIVKLLLYRNTQIYAERNKRISVRKAPELYDLFLDQPDLFQNEMINKPKDIIKVVLNYLRSRQYVQLQQTINNPLLFSNKINLSQKKQFSNHENIPSNGIIHSNNTKLRFIQPEYFFHELCNGTYIPRPKPYRTGNGEWIYPEDLPHPHTFGQWLMQCWMLPIDEPPMRDPFEGTRDECYVLPNVLAKYLRVQATLGRTQETLFVKDSLSLNSKINDHLIITSLKQNKLKTQQKQLHYQHNRNNNKRHLHEIEFYKQLKDHVDIIQDHAHHHTSQFYSSIVNQSQTSSYKRDPVLLTPETYVQYNPVVSPRQSFTDNKQNPIDQLKQTQWNSLMAVSQCVFPKPTDEYNTTKWITPLQTDDDHCHVLCPHEIPTVYKRMTNQLYNRSIQHQLEVQDAHQDNLSIKHTLINTFKQHSSLLNDQQLSIDTNHHRQPYIKKKKKKKNSTLFDLTTFHMSSIGTPPNNDFGFDSDDERDWILSQVFHDTTIREWLSWAETEVIHSGLNKGEKRHQAGELSFIMPRTTIPEFNNHFQNNQPYILNQSTESYQLNPSYLNTTDSHNIAEISTFHDAIRLHVISTVGQQEHSYI